MIEIHSTDFNSIYLSFLQPWIGLQLRHGMPWQMLSRYTCDVWSSHENQVIAIPQTV